MAGPGLKGDIPRLQGRHAEAVLRRLAGGQDRDVALVLKHVILARERGMAGPGLKGDERGVALLGGPEPDVLEIGEVHAHAAAALGAAQGERAAGDIGEHDGVVG